MDKFSALGYESLNCVNLNRFCPKESDKIIWHVTPFDCSNCRKDTIYCDKIIDVVLLKVASMGSCKIVQVVW